MSGLSGLTHLLVLFFHPKGPHYGGAPHNGRLLLIAPHIGLRPMCGSLILRTQLASLVAPPPEPYFFSKEGPVEGVSILPLWGQYTYRERGSSPEGAFLPSVHKKLAFLGSGGAL